MNILAIRACLIFAAFVASAGTGTVLAQSPAGDLWSLVNARYAGERAKETVAYLDRFVRWPGNRGFDSSIAHIVGRLEQAGYVDQRHAAANNRLTYRIERYPMAAPAWEPLDASVTIVGEREPVLQFSTNRNMLATNSFSTPDSGILAPLVDGGDGSTAALNAVDVRGKVVLANAGLNRLFAEAVVRRGAVGVLAYALPAYLQPEKNRRSIQFGGVPRDSSIKSWGIALSYDARERLKGALARGPVMVRVRTQVQWTPNAVEQAVVAEVRGSKAPDERFVFSAHVQEPGANDNASGVGAQVEIARVLADLVRTRRADPARTITMLWGLEIQSTARYLSQDSLRARGVKWGLSLDMVGEDTKRTGGTFLIEKMPDPSAIWTRGEDKHSEWGGSPITKAQLAPHYFNDFVLSRCQERARSNGWIVKTNPFEGGSDHTPFLQAKKPGLLFWHFTDQYYHTDGDRIDMVSADELANVGSCATVSALMLTTATATTIRAVIDETERAALARLRVEAALSAASIAKGGSREIELDILQTWAQWYQDALRTTIDLQLGPGSSDIRKAIESAAARVTNELKRLTRGLST